MNVQYFDASTKRTAREAGLWYALVTVFSIFGIIYADFRFYMAGDAAATAARILGDTWLYRAAIASNLVGQVCQIFVGLAFYKLFAAVDGSKARTMLGLVLTMVAIAFLNMLGKFAPLVLLENPALAQAFGTKEATALAFLFLELQRYGTVIVGIFWGL
jgi:magnesium-transporting ATPase (P-type)